MPEDLTLAHARGPISLRSVALGLTGVILICGLTPYNDYALNNTFLVGNNLPLGVVMLTFLLTVCVNGPLSRFAPRHALSSGEVAVAFTMALVSCALPSSGLMRYLPGALTGPFFYAAERGENLALLDSLQLPRWLFPAYEGRTMREWASDPIAWGFHERWSGDGPIPFTAWLRPMLTWGIFIFALYGALVCMVLIVRRQWFENERLSFPLAQIQLALVEQPPPGRWFNAMLRARGFWIAAGCVFALHAYNGMSNYFPRHVVRIPVAYSVHDLFSEPPWVYVDTKIKDCAIFFSALGVTYFLPGPVAFSLWFFYILANVHRMYLGTYAGDPDNFPRQWSQHFGGILAYALAIFWIGRLQWRLVVRQAFRGERAGEPRGRYLSYRTTFWGLVGCTVVMIAWLTLAGADLFGAVVMVLLLLLLFLLITRIIGESGLIHGQMQTSITKPWSLLGLAGWTHPVSTETYYLGSTLNAMHYDFREPLPVYASHAVRVVDSVSRSADPQSVDPKSAECEVPSAESNANAEAAIPTQHSALSTQHLDRRFGRRLVGLIFLALVVGYFVSFTSMLWTEYTYSVTQDQAAKHPINDWGARDNPKIQILDNTTAYARGRFQATHNVAGHVSFGFIFTALLSWLKLRFTWWPLHPVGYLMVMTFPSAHLWFSILLGWLCKSLIVRFGGARLYTSAKPFFLGLIVGESAAAGFWLVVGIVLSALGVPYRPVNIMPG